ncbi:HAD family phosphatase [Cognatiyoonia sp. IB215446]|uniref:HAD family hydrolase n=1 Tax=Cognatiyoonia sp. IB215446 TaxID=3097355 RepID=UPI002A171247|nr:HAD family phosphatase [Cognatiyoonia sp. IB215446]MDX8346622.1 HAD family phosphatase [Cognatiyoonia sp. IB215446]
MNPRLVIFDCDGVLVDTEMATNTIIAENLQSHGLSITPDQAHTLFAGGTMESAGHEARRRGATLPDDWLSEIYDQVFNRLRQGVDVIDGVWDLLNLLKDRQIAVASNGPMEKMAITLKPSGLWAHFAGRIYSGHDHGPKPAPDMLLRIMRDAGVTAAETVMIDDMRSGCLAAQAAGSAVLDMWRRVIRPASTEQARYL